MRQRKALRITAIPRDTSPGAGFHPMFFAQKFGDTVLAIPGAGKAADSSSVSISERRLKALPLKMQKLFFLIELLIFSVFLVFRRRDVFVHSFLYALPFLLVGRDTTLIIHGSDYKYLHGVIGRVYRMFLRDILIVGKQELSLQLGFKSIPNIFSIPDASCILRPLEEREIDFCFILRNAKVKNPDFPERFYDKLQSDYGVKIAVVGISGEDRSDGLKSIKYHGVQLPIYLQQILQRSKVFVLPSHNEGVSKAMLEAMFCGCSVVVNKGIELPDAIAGHVNEIDCLGVLNIEQFLEVLLVDRVLQNRAVAQNYRILSERVLSQIYERRY